MGEAIENKKQETIDAINAIKDGVKKNRIKIIENLQFSQEMIDEVAFPSGGTSMNDYYNQALFYAEQRAAIKDRTSANVAKWNFNDKSTYQGMFTSNFYDNTANSFGFEFLNLYYIPSDYSTVLANTIAEENAKRTTENEKRAALNPPGEILPMVDESLLRVLTVDEEGLIRLGTEKDTNFEESALTTFAIDDGEEDGTESDGILKLCKPVGTFDTNPKLLDKIALLLPRLNGLGQVKYKAIGYFEVIVEGLELNLDFDPVPPNNTEDPNYVSDSIYANTMMLRNTTDFLSFCGPAFDTSEDDVVKSAKYKSTAKEVNGAYPDLEISPMFPAANLDDIVIDEMEKGTPPNLNWTYGAKDGETPPNTIWKWGVFPKFKWEMKLNPSATAVAIITEMADGGRVATASSVNSLGNFSDDNGILPNVTVEASAPTPGAGSVGKHYWVDSGKLKEGTVTAAAPVPPETESTYSLSSDFVDCGWNTIINNLSNISTTLTYLSNIQSASTVADPIDPTKDTDNQTWKVKIDAAITSLGVVQERFTGLTQGNYSTKKSGSQAIWQAFKDDLSIVITDKSSRVSTLEGYIGGATSGYMENVYNAVVAMIDSKNGFMPDVFKAEKKLSGVNDILIEKRNYYFVLP
jgi:hypothetical protein